MPTRPDDIIRELKQHGYRIVSQNGSHVKLRNPETGKQVIVPIHSKEMKKGTEHAIRKQAGLDDTQKKKGEKEG